MEIHAVSTSSMSVTFTPPEGASGIAFYRATTGELSCQVSANETPLTCSISGLSAGSKFGVEAVACVSDDVCSSSITGEGYTLPDGMLELTRSALLQAHGKIYSSF